jgi:hypothetical protein
VNLTNISRQYLGINKMKIDLVTGTWQDNPGCTINITLVSTSDEVTPTGHQLFDQVQGKNQVQ